MVLSTIKILMEMKNHNIGKVKMNETRVKFYGEHDMSAGLHLKRVASVLENWNESTDTTDINQILEFYNIKKYFDCGIRLEQWDDQIYATYNAKCQNIPRHLGRFCSTISDANLETLYTSIDHNYIDNFWQLVCDYKVHLRISTEVFKDVLTNHQSALWYVLQQKHLAMRFGPSIAEHLVCNSYTAEWLISYFLEDRARAPKLLYFPVEFTQEMRDNILADYVDSDDPNQNYLKLLEQAQSTKEFPVSDKLRLRARKKRELLRDKLFSKSAGFLYGVEVSFKSIPDGSVENSEKEHIYCFAYSHEWIQENQDYPTLLNNFIYLFGYVDRFFRCTFPALKAELDVFERHLGLKGKKEYITGIAFNLKSMQSTLQMQAYLHELQRIGVRIEDLFKWFFEVYLKEEFNAQGFTYSPPSEGTTYAEKCKLLSSSMDGLLKQYRLFCEDGYVDRELFEMSSGHVILNQLPSLRNKKYAYSNSVEFQWEQNLLYSEQSLMTYTEKTGNKYKTLPQLLLNECISMKDFAHYQKNNMQWLINRGIVISGADEKLIVDKPRAFILKDLFEHGVICPSYFDNNLQALVDKLVFSGDMKYENTLFSQPEQDYLNYILNKSEFSNGLDLRNKYSHDTCTLDKDTQFKDYLELLKIMVLIIIKINEELSMKEQISR